MKRVITALTVVVLACSVSYGQEMPSNYEHLKCYDQLIGTWVYKGQALETGIAEKGDQIFYRLSLKWILDRNAVESKFYGEIKGELKITAAALIGWDAAKEQIIEGGMNSMGGHGLTTRTYDAATKTWTSESRGVDGNGEKTSGTSVLTLKDKDTIVFQAFNRKGGFAQGDSPKITLKRAKRAKQPIRLKKAK